MNKAENCALTAKMNQGEEKWTHECKSNMKLNKIKQLVSQQLAE